MLRNLFSASQQSIGIDLDGVSIIVLHKKHNKIKILHTASDEFSSDEKRIKFLREFLINHKICSKNIYVSIPAKYTIKKELQFSAILQETDIKLQLALEQEKYFPGITEKLTYDFVIKNVIKENQNVVVYAAKQKLLADRLNLLRDAKIYPVCVEPDGFAWLRLIDSAQRESLIEDKAGVLLVVQRKTLKIIIFNHYEILYENNEFEFDDVVGLVQRNLKHFTATNNYNIAIFYFIGEENLTMPLRQKMNLRIVSIAKVDNKLLLAYGLALRGFDDNH